MFLIPFFNRFFFDFDSKIPSKLHPKTFKKHVGFLRFLELKVFGCLKLLMDLLGDSWPWWFTSVGDKLYFTAWDGNTRELWFYWDNPGPVISSDV